MRIRGHAARSPGFSSELRVHLRGVLGGPRHSRQRVSALHVRQDPAMSGARTAGPAQRIRRELVSQQRVEAGPDGPRQRRQVVATLERVDDPAAAQLIRQLA